MPEDLPPPPPEARALYEVAGFFLRLGLTAFGGPAAHLALMESEAVRRRRWLTREEFLDRLGAVSLLPGPSSTQMALALGQARAGLPGLLLGGLCFLLPAALLAAACAWAYVRWGSLPQAAGLLYGVRPVVVALLGQAIWNLGRAAVRTPWQACLGLLAAAAFALGVHELAVFLGAGLLMLAARFRLETRTAALAAVPLAPAGLVAPPGLGALFLAFLKLGSIVFGSGYVLVAFLRTDLVTRLHWLTERQLLDAVAVGQVTPGPVFTTATFIGYLLRGPAGAVLATVGIFLPSFLLVAGLGPVLPRLRRSPSAAAFLDGVNLGALALMAVVGAELGRAALIDLPALALLLAALALLLRTRLNPTWIVLGAAAVGLLLRP
ncbi:MAG TPA: chromate efflux transporter [Thermoanaerobaculia bacterium]|nr:chromate efflux transporter [Thermoanaerobaculia bacterium]